MVSWKLCYSGVLGHRAFADQRAVGGEILDLALSQAKLRGRIVKCGSISAYNNASDTSEALECFNVRALV